MIAVRVAQQNLIYAQRRLNRLYDLFPFEEINRFLGKLNSQ